VGDVAGPAWRDVAKVEVIMMREPGLEQHRVELTRYCNRMLGSAFEAEDAVQETLVRAWRGVHRFEGRAALRSWLYRIATNVCYDMRRAPQRRAHPVDLRRHPLVGDGDPADLAASKETVRLALLVALQRLPPRQRAVLILRDVLRWRADEVAGLFGTTTASINSSLQRARATLNAGDLSLSDSMEPMEPSDEAQRTLLARYVEAFDRRDVESLVALVQR